MKIEEKWAEWEKKNRLAAETHVDEHGMWEPLPYPWENMSIKEMCQWLEEVVPKGPYTGGCNEITRNHKIVWNICQRLREVEKR